MQGLLIFPQHFTMSQNATPMHKQIAIFLAVCTIGCATEKQLQKAEAKLSQAGRLAQICSDRFPSRDSIIYRDSVRIDTAHEGEYIFDTIRAFDTVYITKTIPVTKTVTKTKLVIKENTAKIEAAEQAVRECNQEFSEMALGMLDERKELDRYKKLATERLWIMWLVIIAAGLWTFRKFIAQYVN